jgi:hypothetical protein
MWIVRVSFRADADSRQGRRTGGRVVVTVLVAFIASRLAHYGDHNIRQLDDLSVLPLADTPAAGAGRCGAETSSISLWVRDLAARDCQWALLLSGHDRGPGA